VTLLLGFGARAPIVTILGTFLVIRNYVVHPISARNAAVIALVGLFVLSFWGQYRLTLSATFLEASDLLEITEKISEDFPEWDIVAAITDYYPNAQDYYYGQLIWETLYSVVPRRLWTSKPIWYGPYQISNDVFPGVLSPSVYGGFQGTFLSTSTIGAGYAEFGWVAAVVVMFVFGIFWRTIYRYVEVKTPGFAAAALFGYCWSAIPLHMRFFSVTIVNIIISISAALVVFALVSSGRSMRAAPHFQAIHPSRG
jgi:hypothetical protein